MHLNPAKFPSGHASPVTRHPSPVTRHPSPVTRHASPVTRHPSPVTRHASPVTCHEIKNIIFDFGGVICNIDVNLTKQSITALGLKKFDTGNSITSSTGLFEALETGAIPPERFREEIRPYFEHPVTDEQLDAAWNALLLDIPEPRIRMLEALRKNYRIFLLSNSNQIHYDHYVTTFRNQFGYADFDTLFEKAWFSFRIGMKKPSPDIFRHVLNHSRLEPAETLFIDDTLVHVQGAESLGIRGFHLEIERGMQITDLFL
jgi:putative hydrolase of the HAD superfamily